MLKQDIETKNYYERFIGFPLTDEQFMEIVESDYELAEDVATGGDTYNREWFMELLAKKITGRDWPTFGEGGYAFTRFAEKMKINGKAMGYAVPDNFGE